MQLTVREAARFLNVSENTLYRWVGDEEIPCHRVGGQIRFNRTELLEWATARNLKVSTEIFRRDEEAAPLPGVAEALEAGGVFHGLAGADKPSVLRAMVDALRLPEGVDREMLYAVIVARETLGTTALGGGIAIPHVRHPVVAEIASPMIALFFLASPVDFAAPDRQPVHTLFWLVSPTIKAHNHMLSRLASVIRDPGFAAVLARRGAAEEVLAEARRAEAALHPTAGGGK